MNLNPLGNGTIYWMAVVFIMLGIISIKLVSIYKKLSVKELISVFLYRYYYKRKYNKMYNVGTVKGYKEKEEIKEDELYKKLIEYTEYTKIYHDIQLTDILQCINKKYLGFIKEKKVYYYLINTKTKRKFIIFNYKLDEKTKKILSSKSIYYLEVNTENIEVMKLVYRIKSYMLNGV